MLLTDDESKLFFKLHRTLMLFVNERLQVIPEQARHARGIRRTAARSPAQGRQCPAWQYRSDRGVR